MKWLILIPLFLSIASNVFASEIYVAIDGDDTSGDGSFSTPYKTIQKAINEAADGDEVVLKDGVYSGPGNENIDSRQINLTIKSVNGPTQTRVTAERDAVWLSRTDALSTELSIEGLQIDNFSYAIIGSESKINIAHTIIVDNGRMHLSRIQ